MSHVKMRTPPSPSGMSHVKTLGSPPVGDGLAEVALGLAVAALAVA